MTTRRRLKRLASEPTCRAINVDECFALFFMRFTGPEGGMSSSFDPSAGGKISKKSAARVLLECTKSQCPEPTNGKAHEATAAVSGEAEIDAPRRSSPNKKWRWEISIQRTVLTSPKHPFTHVLLLQVTVVS